MTRTGGPVLVTMVFTIFLGGIEAKVIIPWAMTRTGGPVLVTMVFTIFLGGIEAKAVTDCPPPDPPVPCFIPPCSNMLCGPGETCVPDYCKVCSGKCVPVTSCEYNGETHYPGDSFPSSDGCNNCFCGEGGSVGCTKKFCLPTCLYNEQRHEVGASFPATDGCNNCTCTFDGSVACTEMYCPEQCEYNGHTYNVGESWEADNCNNCSCAENGFVVCTKRACVSSCLYNDQTYAAGDSFPAGDGCNSCGCRTDGSIVCTKIDCTPQCPQISCRRCRTGYVLDDNNCQTCNCFRNRCGKRHPCKADFFCNGRICCPDWVKYARCANPCDDVTCLPGHSCQPYCGCFAKCARDPTTKG